MFRRNPYVTAGDIFASLFVFLIFAGIFAVIFIYVGYIGLIIFLSIGVAVGLAYALYVYIKCFIAATKSLSGIRSSNVFKTTILRWFTLFKNASHDAFVDNISVARSAITKSHAYRFLSFRKWMWLIVAPSTFIFGSLLIVAVIVLQALLLVAALILLVGVIFVLCALMFIADILYSVIATGKNTAPAFSGKGNVFKCFEFNSSSSFSNIATSIKNYFVVSISYMKGIWDENLDLGRSNIRMGRGYRVISFQRYFLCLSVATLIMIAIVFDALMLLGLCIAFVFILLANVIWTAIATLSRKIHHK